MSDILGGALDFLLGESSVDDDEFLDPRDLTAEEETMTEFPRCVFLTFGEVIFKYQQIVAADEDGTIFRRLVGGKELELAVAIRNGGGSCEVFTVLPEPKVFTHTDYIRRRIAGYGIGLRANFGGCPCVGDETVLLDGTRLFQRTASAFATVAHPFAWEKGIVKDRMPCWVHLGYSSIAYSDYAKENWVSLLEFVTDSTESPNCRISLELDWIACGDKPIISMWNFVEGYVSRLDLFIITPKELSLILSDKIIPDIEFEISCVCLTQLRAKLGCKCLAMVYDEYTLFAVHESGNVIEKTFQKTERQIIGSLIHAFVKQPNLTNVELFNKSLNKFSLSTTWTPVTDGLNFDPSKLEALERLE